MRWLLVSVLLLACSTAARAPESAPVASALPTPTVVVSARETAAYRTACATHVLNEFIAAFDRGDLADLMTFFSATRGAQPFQWFVTANTRPYGPGLTELPSHFQSWHRDGQRWRLVYARSGSGPSWHGGVDFELQVERTWPGGAVTDLGKGALDCDARTIFVFVLGRPQAP
jgi:hypothetical protein